MKKFLIIAATVLGLAAVSEAQVYTTTLTAATNTVPVTSTNSVVGPTYVTVQGPQCTLWVTTQGNSNSTASTIGYGTLVVTPWASYNASGAAGTFGAANYNAISKVSETGSSGNVQATVTFNGTNQSAGYCQFDTSGMNAIEIGSIANNATNIVATNLTFTVIWGQK